MKKNLFVLSIAICFLGIVLISYEHGPAHDAGLNRTGSQGGAANCNGGGCHGPNVTTTIVSLIVTDAAGAAVTSYVPGTIYNVTLHGHNTASAVCTKFGFQVSATLSSLEQAGSFTALSGSNTRAVSLSGLQIIEHKNPLSDSADNYSVAHFTWTAPAAGSGSVTFYSIINAVGGDGDDEGDDDGGDDDDDDDDEGGSGGYYPNTGANVVLAESGGGSSTLVSNVNYNDDINIYPVPFTNEINVIMRQAGVINIYAANGVLVCHTEVYASASGATRIRTVDMSAGVYYAEIIKGNEHIVRTIVKR